MYTPVAFIIFNRPDTTEMVFNEIARARPPKLFVIADGPRADRTDDDEKCAATRAIIERVDWECEVFKNYSDVNLGCGLGPATGINWVFEKVNEAIILEDDCIPHPTFFRFCDELLEKYRNDERIMQICGSNFQFGHKRTPYSYFFSCHSLCWGWASWRRAWKYFDIGVKLWEELRNTSWLQDILEVPQVLEYRRARLDIAFESKGDVDYWDYQWSFACMTQNGLSVIPNTTLVSNIGWGEDATHTKSPDHIFLNLQSDEMVFPLNHPPYVIRNRDADRFLVEQLKIPRQPDLYSRLSRKVYSMVFWQIRKYLHSHLSK